MQESHALYQYVRNQTGQLVSLQGEQSGRWETPSGETIPQSSLRYSVPPREKEEYKTRRLPQVWLKTGGILERHQILQQKGSGCCPSPNCHRTDEVKDMPPTWDLKSPEVCREGQESSSRPQGSFTQPLEQRTPGSFRTPLCL